MSSSRHNLDNEVAYHFLGSHQFVELCNLIHTSTAQAIFTSFPLSHFPWSYVAMWKHFNGFLMIQDCIFISRQGRRCHLGDSHKLKHVDASKINEPKMFYFIKTKKSKNELKIQFSFWNESACSYLKHPLTLTLTPHPIQSMIHHDMEFK
jgi:hypothetical protein